MSASTERELGRIAQAVETTRDANRDLAVRIDKTSDKLETLTGKISELQQAVGSQSSLLNRMSNANLMDRVQTLEQTTDGLPEMKEDYRFWRRILGGGIHAIWKFAAFLIGSGTIGALLVKYIFH